MTPTERLGADLRSFLRVCYSSMAAQLPEIWRTAAPLKKDRARAAMEAAFRRTADSLRFRSPRTTHAIAVMVMEIAFHTENPDRVGDALNIFIFPDLSSLAGSEVALLTQKWDAILGGVTLTSFVETSMLTGKKKVAPIAGWDEASSQLEAWEVF